MESEPSQNCNSNWVLRYPLAVSAKHKLSIINLQVVNYGIAGQFEPHVDHAMVNNPTLYIFISFLICSQLSQVKWRNNISSKSKQFALDVGILLSL